MKHNFDVAVLYTGQGPVNNNTHNRQWFCSISYRRFHVPSAMILENKLIATQHCKDFWKKDFPEKTFYLHLLLFLNYGCFDKIDSLKIMNRVFLIPDFLYFILSYTKRLYFSDLVPRVYFRWTVAKGPFLCYSLS